MSQTKANAGVPTPETDRELLYRLLPGWEMDHADENRFHRVHHPAMPGNAWVNSPTQAMEMAARQLRTILARDRETRGEGLDLAEFSRANRARANRWHPKGLESWSPSDWLTAVTGELGELASLIKMRNRERDGLVGNKFSPTMKQVADEIADVLTYLDLLAASLGVDLGRATAMKFNEVSERVDFPERVRVPVEGDPKPSTRSEGT